MDRSIIVPMIVMIWFLTTQHTAYAEIVSLNSKISEINTTFNYLKIYRLDPQTKKTEEIKIELDPSTRFHGVESLLDLNKGDEVSIEANYNIFTHEWKALVIGPYSRVSV